MSYERHPHSKLIDDLGAAFVRREFNLSHQRLHAWRKRGIPHGFRPALARLAAIHGKDIPTDFLSPPEPVKVAA